MVEIEELRRRLQERLVVLTKRAHEIDEDLRGHDEDDFEERATEIAGDEVLEDLGEASLLEIAQIKAALKRIELGTFGICSRCKEPIDERRLVTVPHIPFCIDCARAS